VSVPLFEKLTLIADLSCLISKSIHRRSSISISSTSALSYSIPADILTFIILYNNLIPISLIVTMEVVKFQQAQLINADLDMYYAPSDTPALCRTSSLVEELGQIEFVFSDKTGTLTRNEMEFKKCSVAGIPYADVAEEGGEDEEGTRTFEELQGLLYGEAEKSVSTGAIDDREREVAREFMALLAVCHTVIPEVRDGKTHYQASSPDEAALVAGAEMLGYQFHVGCPLLVKCCFTHSS
jgi:phospholipid-transporting ATPase